MGLHTNIESGVVSKDNFPSLVQTIRRQVLKRGREEEIVSKTDEEMADIDGINEDSLLTIKDLLIERDSSESGSDHSFFKENNSDKSDFVFCPITNNLSINRGNSDKLKNAIGKSLDCTLNSPIKLEVNSSIYQPLPSTNNGSKEKRQKNDIITNRNECYVDGSRKKYLVHNSHFVPMQLVDNVFYKNNSDIGLGVKYHALKEMETNEYDKVPKIEEAIYGSRPNVYTKFIEENRDMFMNDCSLRCVFDEVGQIRKFPLQGEYNNNLK
ncbi:Hypothetical protein SRAE_2000317200 [Strongyloides ratti]|uniref:Uncharacterized protein n=1 Tax=Strongyloides ratti TaxID=34506 RepID=A0A090LLS8_STRRB|nr:Hypothetical protein SRAE_2000317200 [Strongyloides ratti]CEF68515.1 Hypothetical protein SRAE_2000317200 [Strongyloides ratti]